MLSIKSPKHQYHQIASVILLIFLIFACSSCSVVIGGFTSAPPGVRDTLSKLTHIYFATIISGNSELVISMRACPPPCPISPSDITNQIKNMRNASVSGKHPLSNFSIRSIETNENEARIKLHNKQDANAPTIEIECFWSGAGWVIVSDTIFGQDGFASRL